MDRSILRRIIVVLLCLCILTSCASVPTDSVPVQESSSVDIPDLTVEESISLENASPESTEESAIAGAESSAAEPEPTFTAWEDIDWTPYDPQEELLYNERRRVKDGVRGDWTWESFTLAGNTLEPFAEDLGLEPLEVFPQFPAEQAQISQRFAKYLYTPYILPNFGENATILLKVTEDGSIMNSLTNDPYYYGSARNACAVDGLLDPYYLFLTTDGKLMLGNVKNSKTRLLYDFGFAPVIFNETLQITQVDLQVRGTLVYIQLEDTMYCYYLPTGEMIELFTVKNFSGAWPENTCELIYSAVSQEWLDYIAQGGDVNNWRAKSGSMISWTPVVNLATQKSAWQIDVEDRNFDAFPSVTWSEFYVLRTDHIRSWSIQ